MTKEQLLAEARTLDPDALAELIEDLRQLPTGDDDDLTPEQRAELRRRIAEVESRQAVFIPGEQALREATEHLSRRR